VSVHVGRLGAVAEIVLDRPPVNAFDEARAALIAAKHCIAAADTPDGFRDELTAVRQLSADARTGALLTAFATRPRHQEVNQ
jgi:hypothetical protein